MAIHYCGKLGGSLYGLGASQGNQQAAMQNTATSNATTMNQLFSNAFGQTFYDNVTNTAYQTSPPGGLPAIKPVKKKVMRAIEALRAEIREWHGDILERCPA